MTVKRRNKVLLRKYQKRLIDLHQQVSYLESALFGKAKTGFAAYGHALTPPHSRHKGGTKRRDKYGLTPKMSRFVQEYPKDMNATQSSIRAGYSKGAAAWMGCHLLKDPKIVRALRVEQEKICRRNRIEQDEVLKEISRIAYSNILDYCSWKKNTLTLFDSKYLTKQDASAIREITETVTKNQTTLRIKLYDKPNALMLLCRYLGILDAPKEDEDPKDTAKRIMDEMNEIDNSIPSGPEEERLDSKLNDLERKVEVRNGS